MAGHDSSDSQINLSRLKQTLDLLSSLARDSGKSQILFFKDTVQIR